VDEPKARPIVSRLFDRWAGKPILVLGGGPSVRTDLPQLAITPACVISANDHGAKQSRFPVEIFVNCDRMHCMLKVPMEKFLRPFGGLIVNRFSWADYRLAEWTFLGNSGLTAVAVAAALGGNPVIVTGIDMWKQGRVYFHDEEPGKIPRNRRNVRPSVTRRDMNQLRELKRETEGANIRPMSGPMTEVFPEYDPEEALPEAAPTAYRRKLHGVEPRRHCLPAGFRFASQDVLQEPTWVEMMPKEYERMVADRPHLLPGAG
jgi:hypothetical protein